MDEASEIVDGKGLEAWLKTRPIEAALVIAHRAQQRVLPIAWQHFAQKRELTPLPFLRCNLISGEICYAGSPEVKNANVAVDASFAAAEYSFAAAKPTSAATVVANAAYAVAAGNTVTVATDAWDATTVVVNTAVVADAATDAAPELWKNVRQDAASLIAGQNLSTVPLWADDDNPLRQLWDDLVPELRAQFTGSEQSARAEEGIDYSFWIDWYDRALKGTETRWEMIAKIALIEDDVWQGDPSVLMRRIGHIWSDHTRAASPNAEIIRQDPEDQKFYSEPKTTLNAEDATDALDRIKDAASNLRELKAQGNYCLATLMSEHLDRIEQTVARYANRPLRLYDLCINITHAVEHRIHDGELTANDRHLAEFMRELERSSLDILNDDEEVARKIRARSYVRISKLNETEKDRVSELTAQAVEESKPEFGEELAASVETVLDDTASDKDRSDAGYELGSRLTRMAKLKRDAVAASDDAGKVAKGGKAVWDLVTAVYTWFS